MLIRQLTMILAATAVVISYANAQPVHHNQESLEETAPATGTHGGTLRKVGLLQVETVIEAGALKLFVYDQQGHPLDLQTARGLATLQIPGEVKRYRYDLFPEVRRDKNADSLTAAADLSRFTGQQVDLAIQLLGVEKGKKRPAEFTASVTVPLTHAQQVAAAIATQEVCPVSGEPLGSMGKPIAVAVGDQTVYVCCAGCVDAVKEDPEKYLPAKAPVTALPTTADDSVAIAAQKLCPVMDESLGGMGTPFKTVVEGRVVYLCCPGCAKILHANPTPFLVKLTKWGVVPPVAP